MAPKAADILAEALESDAQQQEHGTLNDIELHIKSVQQKVMPMNDIPRPIYKLAMRFWQEWAKASRQDWHHKGAISENDWPAMARTIAQHVRTGSLPNDKLILENFVRRGSSMPWKDLSRLFGNSSKG
jgi:hypothetical protein